MPFHPIHLAQTATARGWSKAVGPAQKDAQIINGVFEVAQNNLLGTKTVYVSKRWGSTTGSTIGTDPILLKHYSNLFGTLYQANSGNVYSGTTNWGAAGSFMAVSTNYVIPDLIVGSLGILSWVLAGVGWYVYSDADTVTFPTFTGTTTNASAVVTTITDTTGIYSGQLVSAAAGITGGTRVLTVDSATQITMDANATATGARTITREAIAKVLDADYPANAVSVTSMDGYFFVGTSTGRIYQSAINDPATYDSADFISADYSGDGIFTIFKHQNYIVASGNRNTIQYFYNAGNPSGSVLSAADSLTVVGLRNVKSGPIEYDGAKYLYMETSDPDSSGKGQMGLYRLTGTNTFQRVSDDVWSSIISDSGGTLLGTILSAGKQLLVLHSAGDTSDCIVYDSSVNGFTIFSIIFTSAHGASFTKSLQSDSFTWATGNTWTDSSAAYTLTIQTEPQDMNNGMDATDTWADLLADTESSGTTALDYTDDDYATWNPFGAGTFDMTVNKKRITGGGTHNIRAYRLTHSANTGFRAQILRINHVKGDV